MVKPEGAGGEPRVSDIAVIGMAGRYAGAEDLSGLWSNLVAGRCAITEIPRSRWDWRNVDASDAAGVSRWGALLEDVEHFDAEFFGIDPAEASILDPQLRLFLEVAWETLEDAGYAGEITRGSKSGVWVGCGADHYLLRR